MLDDNANNGEKVYKSPTRKLVKFFERSRNKWKEKHQDLKYKVKLMKNRIRYLENTKSHLKKRVKELEKELNQYKGKKKT